MQRNKMAAGEDFPEIEVKDLDGNTVNISKPAAGKDWKMIVVYRGKHCPVCTKYLNALEGFKNKLSDASIDLAVVSADSEAQAKEHLEKLDISYPVYYGLSIEQMQQLGLYISHPRSEQETDHPFPEPGLFVVNDKQQLHVVDLANNPFVRPDLERLVDGLHFIKDPENNYPIRGTYPEK